MEWRIRIHDVILPIAIQQWAEKRSTSYLMVHHECGSERPHHHLWIRTDFAEQTIRKLPKDLSLTNGNSDFSIQRCKPERREEYLQQMFNLKKGNKPTFVAEKGVPEWKQYEERSAQATVEYVDAKKKPGLTKSDMIDILTQQERLQKQESIEHIQDLILLISREHRTVFSINAIREIIMYVTFETPHLCVKDHVLKVFR